MKIKFNKHIVVISFITMLLTPVFNLAQIPSYIPTNGLVGWWPFNGNANDESGNSLNGNVLGANLTSDRFNAAISAYDYNYNNAGWGTQNNAVYIPYSPILNVSKITVSAWINPRNYFWSGNSGDPNSTIIERFQYGYSNPNGQTWVLGFDVDGLYAAIFEAAPNNNQNVAIVTHSIPVVLNSWHNVVFSYDEITLNLYLNGILVESINTSIPLNMLGNSGVVIGESHAANGYWRYCDGKIDDIGIWNRALTTQEISNLYAGCQLSINTQPLDQTINISNNAEFIVGSSDPNATFQWQTDLGVGYQNLNSVGQYSGTTTNTLTVSNVTMSNNNQPFRCVINSGSCADTSDIAILNVNNNVGIDDNLNNNLFSVFPNPSKNVINVNIDSKLIGEVYKIYDNTGRIVLSEKIIKENTTIDISSLSNGVYVFSLGENTLQTVKVVKE